MFNRLATALLGSRNDRVLKSYAPTVLAINAFEPHLIALTDEALAAKTLEFRARLNQGSALDSVLPEAFAVVREVSRRVLGLRHYDVQLLGGLALHEGKIAQMHTGEGKTLVATLPVYLNALAGHGVHVVTVNEYLAQRDAQQMGRVYAFLGLTTAVVGPSLPQATKKEAYGADITYGTGSEFCFDYLRDNMALSVEDQTQRGHVYALVDEVDSILIDEARTPLVIGGPADENHAIYPLMDRVACQFVAQTEEDESSPGDYAIDAKRRRVVLSEAGLEKAERLLQEAGLLEEAGLYDPQNIVLLHHLDASLRAHALYLADVQYLVCDGKIIIVDEMTGRVAAGRRWAHGLHQAVEAKEGVQVQREDQTVASITFQNFFRLYTKLSGMTGTADTEAQEFMDVYGLEVVVIPTHRPMVRTDAPDAMFLSQEAKFDNLIEDIKQRHAAGQPVLVGTSAVETSEKISARLTGLGIKHAVLNAKQHEHEADVVAQAGRLHAITIATNMAGRGTDIVLGGSLEAECDTLPPEADANQRAALRAQWRRRHEEVVALGGLHIIGTERNESRRVDNQLRGRAGRQGDPGSSRFYLSFEDKLMKVFGGTLAPQALRAMGMRETAAVESRMVGRQIEIAQKRMEAFNYDQRKSLLEYDSVANEQRRIVYGHRQSILTAESVEEDVTDMRHAAVMEMWQHYLQTTPDVQKWSSSALEALVKQAWGMPVKLNLSPEMAAPEVEALLLETVDRAYRLWSSFTGIDNVRQLEKQVLLGAWDKAWRQHLANMNVLRQGINLRGFAQKQPKQEFKKDSFYLFKRMVDDVRYQVVTRLQAVTQASYSPPVS